MTCFHPLQAAWIPGSGKKPLIYSIGKPRPEPLAGGYEPLELPCGQCDGCRIDRSKEWAARIIHESQMHQENSFITLTYSKEYMPSDGSLDKGHFQKFMKRLRQQNEDKKIRYFHCGEYGPKLQRPHYHACIFGLDFDDRIPFSTTNEIVTYTSETLTKIWGKGFTTCGELNYQTAAYTARYIMDKITGKRAEKHYARLNEYTGEIIQLQPEYITMSLGRKPGQGIGGTFYEKYKTDFFPRDECPIPGKGVYKGVPKYYEQIYKGTKGNALEEIKRKRKEYRDTHKDQHTSEMLRSKEQVKKAQLNQLKRHTG